jgi:hypothetical protein
MSQSLWEQAWAKESEGIDLTNARVGGRATKLLPNKEDINFWQISGPMWVEDYIAWRKANTNWKIWTTPDGRPAIELELMPEIAGVPVKMVIDRIFEVNGKISSSRPQNCKKYSYQYFTTRVLQSWARKTFGVGIEYETCGVITTCLVIVVLAR